MPQIIKYSHTLKRISQQEMPENNKLLFESIIKPPSLAILSRRFDQGKKNE
jgi:hypothetical protein